jgi:hypothetical protein
MSDTDKEKIDALLREAASIFRSKADSEIPALLGDGILDEFLGAMAPRKSDTGQTIYDYLLANKHRLELVALLRHAIQQNYSMSGTANGHQGFVSPDFHQWFDDGVMFLQGKERFAGLIGLYQNGQVKFAVAARDIHAGKDLGPDDLLFLNINEFRQLESKKAIPASLGDLDPVLEELGRMLGEREENEAEYQSFFTNNPWVFGMQYVKIDSHTRLDDENIPDFTGVRARDNARDIIEIKQPFMPLFRRDGSFRAEFHRAWQQAEDYLEFALSDTNFLYKRKGLRFDNPHCNLLLGYDLSPNQRAALRRKEKMNPRITILTYNDLVALSKNTAQRIKMLKGWDQEDRSG